MRIIDNKIEICGKIIDSTMSFSTVEKTLSENIAFRKSGSHIAVGKIEFYGFKGNCILYFQNDCLCRISISTDWSRYPCINSEGQRKSIDKVVTEISNMHRANLVYNFGNNYDVCGKTLLFKTDAFIISSNISQFNDEYSIGIEIKK